jgi:hypothetical protein
MHRQRCADRRRQPDHPARQFTRALGRRLDIDRLAHHPEIAGGWSHFTGYFAPRIAAYDLPTMKTYIADHPDARVALDQLTYAGAQAVLLGKAAPEAAMARAQAEAEALMKPYVEQTALKLLE